MRFACWYSSACTMSGMDDAYIAADLWMPFMVAIGPLAGATPPLKYWRIFR